VDNLELGGDYRNISKVISISIIYFEFGLSNDDNYVYHGVTDVRGLQTPTSFRFRRKMGDNTFKTLCSKDIFPEYYLIHIEHFQDVIATDLDEWIYMLKHSAIRADFKAKNIERAGEKLTLLKMKPEERRHYEKYLMDVAVERDVIKTARSEGLQEGRQEGLQEGENKAKLEMAHKLLADGMDKDKIALLTGLSVETITQDA
jgi:predicted transposase YdaD